MAAEVQIQTVSVWEINATRKSKGKNVDLKEMKMEEREFHSEDIHQLLHWLFNHNRACKYASTWVLNESIKVNLLHPSAVHSLHSALPHNVMKGVTK